MPPGRSQTAEAASAAKLRATAGSRSGASSTDQFRTSHHTSSHLQAANRTRAHDSSKVAHTDESRSDQRAGRSAPSLVQVAEASRGQKSAQDDHTYQEESLKQANGDEDSGKEDDEDGADYDDDEEEDDDDEDEDEDDDDQGSSPIPTPDAEDDEDETMDEDPFKFLQNVDPSLFTTSFDANWPLQANAHQPRQSVFSFHPPSSSANGARSEQQQGVGAHPLSNEQTGVDGIGRTDDAEFYSNMIQMLTHVLGSSNPMPWQNQPTPGSQLAPSPFAVPQSSPAPGPDSTPSSRNGTDAAKVGDSRATHSKKQQRQPGFSELQPLIHALISRLGGDHHSPRHPVGEQDLTSLLQSLMAQQQRQSQQAKPASDSTAMYNSSQPQSQETYAYPSGAGVANVQPLHFADLVFEDEDEDDPDFNPDLNPNLPMPSAWSLAVQDVVTSEESRAAAAAVAASNSNTPAARTPSARTPAATASNPRNDAEDGQPSAQTMSASSHLDQLRSSRQGTGRDEQQRGREESPERRARPETLDSSVLVFSPSGRPIRSTRIRQLSPSSRSPRNHDLGQASVQSRRHEQQPQLEADIDAEEETAPDGGQHQGRREAQTELAAMQQEPNSNDKTVVPKKRGRKPILEAGEAQRRRAQRNVEYQRMRRQMKKMEESEHSETVMELRAEVKVLRAEMERLRNENAMLRAQRQMGELQRGRGYSSVNDGGRSRHDVVQYDGYPITHTSIDSDEGGSPHEVASHAFRDQRDDDHWYSRRVTSSRSQPRNLQPSASSRHIGLGTSAGIADHAGISSGNASFESRDDSGSSSPGRWREEHMLETIQADLDHDRSRLKMDYAYRRNLREDSGDERAIQDLLVSQKGRVSSSTAEATRTSRAGGETRRQGKRRREPMDEGSRGEVSLTVHRQRHYEDEDIDVDESYQVYDERIQPDSLRYTEHVGDNQRRSRQSHPTTARTSASSAQQPSDLDQLARASGLNPAQARRFARLLGQQSQQ